jgi:transketolase C-terminal domain/subunit
LDTPDTTASSADENKFGKRMISIGILSTAMIIGFVGLMATSGKMYVLSVAFILLLIGGRVLYKALK